MIIKKDTLDTVLDSDINFKRLYSAHSKLKIKIKDLNKKKFPTTAEVAQKKQHQKQKLILKDKMELILSQS
jgi:uncharacterized protein YdcH (DUF465 family)